MQSILGRTMPAWLSLCVLLFFTITTVIFGLEAVRLGLINIAMPSQSLNPTF